MAFAHRSKPVGASMGAVQRHYDISDDFYALFLDPHRAYSCAMFERHAEAEPSAPGEALARAQQRKQDWHLEESRAVGADRVLDIGCGWGATLRRLLETDFSKRAVGLTLSESQKKYAEALFGAKVEIRLESWAEHRPDAPYDSIVSIGAFEHFARFKISHAEKIDSYRRYFDKCRSLLRNIHVCLSFGLLNECKFNHRKA